MATAKDIALSTKLQDIASEIDDAFADIYGERVGFVLIMCPFNQLPTAVQYVANVERGNGVQILQALLHRWQQQQPDVPTHETH